MKDDERMDDVVWIYDDQIVKEHGEYVKDLRDMNDFGFMGL